jgi:hypothetical protein
MIGAAHTCIAGCDASGCAAQRQAVQRAIVAAVAGVPRCDLADPLSHAHRHCARLMKSEAR